jgi:hypothetical protein
MVYLILRENGNISVSDATFLNWETGCKIEAYPAASCRECARYRGSDLIEIIFE